MFPQWEWTILTLPPRHFSWRVRGNPLYWSISERAVLENDNYDLLLVTSMVDLACLRGLVPRLALLPSMVYFHENQFEYPRGSQQSSIVEAQMVSLYSALAADRIVFNSVYNRDSFLRGCRDLLKRLPDKVPGGIVPELKAKSVVLPVPLASQLPAVNAVWPGSSGDYPHRPLRLLWVGRFEYDKGGELLHSILTLISDRNLPFEVAVVGQQFRRSPAVFAEIEQQFCDCIVQFGYLKEASHFHQILQGADIVLSTALHEFQGLAVLEAIDAGCIPVVPNRLVYPEIVPQSFCYPPSSELEGEEAQHAADLIEATAQHLASGSVMAPDISAFSQEALKPRYSSLFEEVGALGY
jgi:glycosyltransferase involved in cell wall biosynthesis